VANRATGAYQRPVSWWRKDEAAVITDAPPSPAEEQHRRQKTYTIIMAVHIVGFALSGVLYYEAWWLGLVVLLLTTPLPWIAVIIANAPTRRQAKARGVR
jgi:fatty acid desaturase